jgi:hypothetical protein
MAQSKDNPIDSRYAYVLGPFTTAEQTIETEKDEVSTECDAFNQFKGRVADTEISPPTQPPQQRISGTRFAETRSRGIERVRSIFRDTVMSVDHYEAVYGESLDEHVEAELSAEVAAGLREETTVSLTEYYKSALITSVDNAVYRRKIILENLDEEARALDRIRTEIVDLFDVCDSSLVPLRLQSDIRDELDEIAQQRQETIHRRNPSLRTDGHDLCTYLYHEEDWTYPVLTALARFRQDTN